MVWRDLLRNNAEFFFLQPATKKPEVLEVPAVEDDDNTYVSASWNDKFKYIILEVKEAHLI